MSKHSLLAAAPQQCEEEEQRKHSVSSSAVRDDSSKSKASHNGVGSSSSGVVNGDAEMEGKSGDCSVSSPSSQSILPSEPRWAGNTVSNESSASSSSVEEPRLKSQQISGGAIPSNSTVIVKEVEIVPEKKVEGRTGGIPNPRASRGSSGRWTAEEHTAFLSGLRVHGREWKKVARLIPSRTAAQIRSHAQKYFAKLARDARVQSTAGAGPLLGSVACVGGDVAAGVASHGLAPLVPRQPTEGEGSVGGAQEVPQGLPAGSMALRSSVVERVSRIMQDPDSVQAEVEQTLEALRDKYALLQQRLARNAQPVSNLPARPAHVIRPDPDPDRNVPSQNNSSLPTAAPAPAPTPSLIAPSVDAKTKPAPDTATTAKSHAPPSTQTNDFLSKELIALSVLGRSLPCSAPNQTKRPRDAPSVVVQQDNTSSSQPQTASVSHDQATSNTSTIQNQPTLRLAQPQEHVQISCSDTHDDNVHLDEPLQKRQKTMPAPVSSTTTTTPNTKEKHSGP